MRLHRRGFLLAAGALALGAPLAARAQKTRIGIIGSGRVGSAIGAAWVKAGKRLPGVEEILVPGELEGRAREQRLRDGIPVEEETWSGLKKQAEEMGMAALLA